MISCRPFVPIAAVLPLLVQMLVQPPARAERLEGAGGTFAAPLYQTLGAALQRRHPEELVIYHGTGSEEGDRQMRAGQIDMFGSEMPMAALDLRQGAESGRYLQLATTVGAMAVIYNLPERPGVPLRLTPDTVAAIFAGQIRDWSDRRLRQENGHVPLPKRPIMVIHRADGSGSTYVFSRFLTLAPSGVWRRGVGALIDWPRDSRGSYQTEGVAREVGRTPYSIGYVEYAQGLKLCGCQSARIQNASGRFVAPSVDSIKAAIPGDAALRAQPAGIFGPLSTSGSPAAYPIASFTYLVVAVDSLDPRVHRTKGRFLRFLLTSGQLLAPGHGFAPLPPAIVQRQLADVNRFFPDSSTSAKDDIR